MTTAILYKDEVIATGEGVPVGLMFWTGIKIDPVYDLVEVRNRLQEIWNEDRIHFELSGDTLRVPPAYRAQRFDGIV